MKLRFTKMQGCGNDYIYLDCRADGVPENIVQLAVALSARRHSIGADGIVCICAGETEGADGKMRIFNADGSEARMCGNGIRCVAEWLWTHDAVCGAKTVLRIDTLSGTKALTRVGDGQWRAEMGCYSLLPENVPAVELCQGEARDVPLEVNGRVWAVTAVNVGNPHCVTVVPEVDELVLEAIGPDFEHHRCFPEGVNTEFVQIVNPVHLRMRVWERGSGETWACGTGACATAIAMVERGFCPADADIAVQLRGGVLTIRVDKENHLVRMTGPAVTVYEGTVKV